jgi:hypothetical protein
MGLALAIGEDSTPIEGFREERAVGEEGSIRDDKTPLALRGVFVSKDW